MRLSTSLLALAAFTQSVLAQSQSGKERSLTRMDGYSTTRIFAPFYIANGAKITPTGSSGPDAATTTWSIPNNMVSSFTLGPNTAINTFLPVPIPLSYNGTKYTSATRIINCAYTPAAGSQAMTAECLQTIHYLDAANATSTAYATTTFPRPASETTFLPGLQLDKGNVTAWDGMVDLYVTVTSGQALTSTEEGGKVVTKTQGAGMPQITAMVQAVVAMAAGAAAMAV